MFFPRFDFKASHYVPEVEMAYDPFTMEELPYSRSHSSNYQSHLQVNKIEGLHKARNQLYIYISQDCLIVMMITVVSFNCP